MQKFHVGLDFGTKQTKACIFNIGTETREFVKFENDSYFLPSIVNIDNEDRFVYGASQSLNIEATYSYFKMAAAEDKEFILQTDGISEEDGMYGNNTFDDFSAEFLCVLYITFIQLEIKEQIKANLSAIQKPKFGGFLKKDLSKQAQKENQKQKEQASFGHKILNFFFGNKTEPVKESEIATEPEPPSPEKKLEDVKITIKMGIPTEWSHKRNLYRKRKFEHILITSAKIQERVKTLDNFLSFNKTQLEDIVKKVYKKYDNEAALNKELNNLGIAVYPESAAGLVSLIETNQIASGYYGALDIGAGTTDLSYFKVEGRRIKFIASESYLLGANTFYNSIKQDVSLAEKEENFAEEERNDTKFLQKKNQKLCKKLRKYDEALIRHSRKLFSKRVRWYRNADFREFNNSPILFYGGGSLLPLISGNIIGENPPFLPLDYVVWNDGNMAGLNHTGELILERTYINEFNFSVEKEVSQKDIPVLVVAYGLSFISSSQNADWFSDEWYNHQDKERDNLIDIEEVEMNIVSLLSYDILAGDWV